MKNYHQRVVCSLSSNQRFIFLALLFRENSCGFSPEVKVQRKIGIREKCIFPKSRKPPQRGGKIKEERNGFFLIQEDVSCH